MEHTVMPGRRAPTHDLIRLREPIALFGPCAAASVGPAGARTGALGGRPPRLCP